MFRFWHQVFLGLVCTPYEFVLIVLIIQKKPHLSLTIAQLSSVSYNQKLKWGTDGNNSHSGLSDHDSCGLRMSVVSPRQRRSSCACPAFPQTVQVQARSPARFPLPCITFLGSWPRTESCNWGLGLMCPGLFFFITDGGLLLPYRAVDGVRGFGYFHGSQKFTEPCAIIQN